MTILCTEIEPKLQSRLRRASPPPKRAGRISQLSRLGLLHDAGNCAPGLCYACTMPSSPRDPPGRIYGLGPTWHVGIYSTKYDHDAPPASPPPRHFLEGLCLASRAQGQHVCRASHSLRKRHSPPLCRTVLRPSSGPSRERCITCTVVHYIYVLLPMRAGYRYQLSAVKMTSAMRCRTSSPNTPIVV